MTRINFRPATGCTRDSFKQLITTIRSMPEVKTTAKTLHVRGTTHSMDFYTAILYDGTDEGAVKKAIASLQNVGFVIGLNKKY